jgi:hypothetical protein
MSSRRFTSTTAAFELPSVPHAVELFEELQSNWVGWIENRLDGIFVVVQAPERISELDELLASVEKWVTDQAFLAIRFHLEGRAYILQRGGFIGRADGDRDSDA